MRHLNYLHLRHFHAIAQAGSVVEAARGLHLTPQTLSAQLRQLEDDVGGLLFERIGRGLQLTPLGETVLRYSNEIFSLGAELAQVVRSEDHSQPLAFRVGLGQDIAKVLAQRLLTPALTLSRPLRLLVVQKPLAVLAEALSKHELDLVLSDAPLGVTAWGRLESQPLAESTVTFHTTQGSPPEAPKACLGRVPLLLPTAEAPLRRDLEQWFHENGVHPTIVGEFNDSALLKSFAMAGLGAFPAPTSLRDDLKAMYGVSPLCELAELRQTVFANVAPRRSDHPAVQRLLQGA
jgi:LysR family transcriptional activator of nhaA